MQAFTNCSRIRSLNRHRHAATTSETDAVPEDAPSTSARHTVTFLVASTTAVCTRHGEGRGAEGGERALDFPQIHEPRVRASAVVPRFEHRQCSAHGPPWQEFHRGTSSSRENSAVETSSVRRIAPQLTPRKLAVTRFL